MDRTIVYARTDKGNQAIVAPDGLAGRLIDVLGAIDGKSSIEDLSAELGDLEAAELEAALATLVRDDLICDSTASPDCTIDGSTTRSDYQRRAQDLRDKIKAKREEAGRPVSAVDAEDEKNQSRLREEAEEQARLLEEEQARLLAEEQAWLEVEDKLRREEAEEKLRREQEAQRKRANAVAPSKSRKAGSTKRRGWGKSIALGIALLVVASVAMTYLIPLAWQISRFEKSLSAQFKQPISIKAIHLRLLPQPHLRFDDVEIGGDGQIKIPQIRTIAALGKLFSDRKAFKSVELDSPTISEEGLGWILFGTPLAGDTVFGSVSVANARLESRNLDLPVFNATLQTTADGAWTTITAASADKNMNLELKSNGPSIQIDVKSASFKIPFGSALTLDEFVATGTADRTGLALTDFKGFVYGGTLSGNARLTWGTKWNLAGHLSAKQIDASLLVPRLLDGARVAGGASYAMQATDSGKLFSAPRLEGLFAIPQGTLLGTDLGDLLLTGVGRGDTKFTLLAGKFIHAGGATQFRQVSLTQASLVVEGMVDVDVDQNIRGRVAADLKLPTDRRRANLAISGTPEKLEWRRQ